MAADLPVRAREMTARGDHFWRSVLVVLTGTAAAQAIPLLGSLVLARIYAPAAFGLFASWLGLVSVAAVMLTGRFEMAVAIEEEGAPRRVAVTATLLVIGCGAVAALLGLAIIGIAGALRGVDATLAGLGVPVAACIAASQTWQAWLAAEGRFHDLSMVRIVQATGVTLAQVVAGLWLPNATSLAVAHGAGMAVGLLVATRRMPLGGGGMPSGGAARVAMRAFVSRNRRFPLLSLPADSVNTAAAQLPLLLVATRFGADAAGWLALTLRVLGAPIALLGSSVLDVFRRRSAASWREHGHCHDDYLRTFRILGLGAVAAAVPLALLAEPLFALAFGERWRMSGTMALWLLPMFALRFVASPLSYVFYVAGKQHVDLAWQIGLLAVTLASLSLPAQMAGAIQWYGVGYAIMYVVYLMLSHRLSRGEPA